MEHLLHVDHFVHDLGLTHVSWNSVQYERVDVRLELVPVHGRINGLPPQLHRDIVRNELAFARILKEGFAYFCARVDGAEYVATSAMIVTRDRAEGFALRAFATARRAKKQKSVVFHHGETSIIPPKEPAKQVPSFRSKSRNHVQLLRDLATASSTPKACGT